MAQQNHEKPTVEYGFRRFIITVTLITASLLELIDTTIVNVSLPVIRGNLGATLSDVTWVIAAYTTANAIIVPITGWLSSKFGRKRYFVGSILLFTFASYMCGESGTIESLIWWRFVQGIGGGALLATANAVLVEIYPDDQIGFANAMFGIGAVVGPTIGPVLGGYLTDAYAWPAIFHVNIPVGILAAILAMIYIKEPHEKMETGNFDWQGLLLLIIGIGSLQVVLEKGSEEDWFDTAYIIYLTITAGMGIIGFVWWELKKAVNPIVDLRILKTRETAIGTLYIFILGIGLYGVLFIYPQFVQNLLGFSAYQSGISLLPGGLSALLVMPILGISLRKGVSPRLLAGIGFTLFFVCCYMLSGETLQSGGIFYGDFFWAQVFRGISTAMLFVPLTTIALSRLKGAAIAQGSGLTNMARQLGGSFGLAAISTFVDYRSAFYRSHVVEDISRYSLATQERLDQLTNMFMSKGAGMVEATQQAYGAINGIVIKNVLQLTYTDAFFYVALFFLCCIPLLLLIRKVDSDGAPAGH